MTEGVPGTTPNGAASGTAETAEATRDAREGAPGGEDLPGAPGEAAPAGDEPLSGASPQKQDGRFRRAESAARRAFLLVGSGILAYVIGGFVMSGLSVRLAERVGPITQPTAAWVVQWVLLRAWLWAVLPVFGWAAGRYLCVPAMRFAVTGVVSGELFGLLLATASDGLDWVLGSPSDMAMRAATLVGGAGLVFGAVSRGLAGAAAAQHVANVEAEKRKAEYAEFLARAEGQAPPEQRGS